MSPLNDPFVSLRPALAPHLAEASPATIRAELGAQGIDADAAEDFLGSLGHIASSIGTAVAPRLPGIAQGALQGASAGMALGPYGALIGALGGGLMGGLSSPGPAHPAAPSAPGPAVPVPGGGAGAPALPAGAGALGAAGPLAAAAGSPGVISALLGAAGSSGRAGPGGAAGALLGLLSQPQVSQALMAMLAGSAGSRTVPVAGQAVPVAAIPNMISELAAQAAAEWEEAYGAPESETLLGLPEGAGEAERAQSLAQAIAVESLVGAALGPHAEASGGDSGESDAEADPWESGYDEGTYDETGSDEASYDEYVRYDPVYLGDPR